MALLYLIRHAHTRQVSDQPAATWSLSERGRRQAEQLGQMAFWSDVVCIASSPEPKALDTAAPAARYMELEVRAIAGLREIERPAGFVPDYEAAVAACFASPQASVHGWETADDARRRMVEAVEAVAAQSGGRPCAVVSHGLVLSLYIAHLRGDTAPSLAEWRAIPMPGWTLLDTDTREMIQPFRGVS